MSDDKTEEIAEPTDDEMEGESLPDYTNSDDLTTDEVIPAARKFNSFESGGVGEAEEAMQEGANLTVSAKDAERKALEEAMQRFLQQGGKIQSVPSDATARTSPKAEKEE